MKIDLYDDGIGAVELIQYMGTDLTIVNAARVSFGKEKEKIDDKDKKLINYLIKNKHTSTLEHNTITLRFTVPLFVRSQHHRHRTWSYNEISRRYTAVDLNFYEPEKFRTQHRSNRQASNDDQINPVIIPDLSSEDDGLRASSCVEQYHKLGLRLYNDLLKAGVCREQARGVLPQNLYTQYYGTVNLSNLLKFIELRIDEHAQWEIRLVAQACLNIAKTLWPEAVGSYCEIRGRIL
jgi:thymidylate synthase, flavin-dependent